MHRVRSRIRRDDIEFKRFCESHSDELEKVYDMLEDELSRKTFEGVLKYRCTNDTKALKGIVRSPQYFQRDIISPVKDEVFLDGGAFIGDTLDEFVKKFSVGNYKRVYAWEPDIYNLRTLRKKAKKYKNVTVVPYGMWSEKTELHFEQTGTAGSTLSEGSGESVKVDSIDNQCSDEKVTFIKMDIEGAEQGALKGAINIIKRDRPRLTICIYHSPEDLYEIPLWVKSVVPEYKLYIRHHTKCWTDTVLYASL